MIRHTTKVTFKEWAPSLSVVLLPCRRVQPFFPRWLLHTLYRLLSSSHLEDPLVGDLRNNLSTVQYLRGWSCLARLEDLGINRMLSLVLCRLSWSSWYSPSWRLEAVIPEDWVDSWIWWVNSEVSWMALWNSRRFHSSRSRACNALENGSSITYNKNALISLPWYNYCDCSPFGRIAYSRRHPDLE